MTRTWVPLDAGLVMRRGTLGRRIPLCIVFSLARTLPKKKSAAR